MQRFCGGFAPRLQRGGLKKSGKKGGVADSCFNIAPRTGSPDCLVSGAGGAGIAAGNSVPGPNEERVMRRNRIMPHFELPAPRPQPPAAATFVLVPTCCLPPANPAQWLWQQSVYQWAREQAEAVVRPSLPERDLLAVWN
jgi:hypothetical protein